MSTKVTFYGHAAIGLETGGHFVLIDPFFSGNPQASLSADQVKPDFIIVTHGHGDHLGDTVAIAKRTGAMVISNFEVINWLEAQGLKNLHAQHIGGGFNHPFGYVKLTEALHGSSMPDGGYGGHAAGVLITTKEEGKKLYFAGDTGLFDGMRLLGEEGIDLAMLPIGDNYTMGPDDALRAVKLLNPKYVIPIHYNTWPPIAQDPQAWTKRVMAETKSQAHVLKPGESFSL